jgi:glycosyltransferase involved in cell wall biosynthesis
VHIVIQTQFYPPEIGAPQTRLSHIARQLRNSGHEVTVLTTMPNYPTGRVFRGYGGLFRAETDSEGIRILRAASYPTNRLQMLPRMASYLSFVASSFIVGALRLRRVDILLTESPPLFLGISGLLLSVLKRTRWIFNVSDLWPASAVTLGALRPGLALKLAEMLEAWCYSHAWLVTGQSKEILADISERFPNVRRYHLSNGVDVERFTPARRSKTARERLGGVGKCVAIYAGLHGLAQRLDQILDAAFRLQHLENLIFVLVGDGPQKKELVSRAKAMGLENVLFLDPLPSEAMPEVLSSADIALVPLGAQLRGAVPSKLYEAMGVGVAVVLAADGEPASIVRESNAGVVVMPNDAEALAGAVERLAKSPEERLRMGRNGRRTAVETYNRIGVSLEFARYLEQAHS